MKKEFKIRVPTEFNKEKGEFEHRIDKWEIWNKGNKIYIKKK